MTWQFQVFYYKAEMIIILIIRFSMSSSQIHILRRNFCHSCSVIRTETHCQHNHERSQNNIHSVSIVIIAIKIIFIIIFIIS